MLYGPHPGTPTLDGLGRLSLCCVSRRHGLYLIVQAGLEGTVVCVGSSPTSPLHNTKNKRKGVLWGGKGEGGFLTRFLQSSIAEFYC